jgi:Na+-driven multidrug efflux pump
MPKPKNWVGNTFNANTSGNYSVEATYTNNCVATSSSIAVTVMMLSVLPSLGVAQAVLTLVGQSLGEKNPQKAEQMTWSGVQLSLIYMSTIALTFFLIPDFYQHHHLSIRFLPK